MEAQGQGSSPSTKQSSGYCFSFMVPSGLNSTRHSSRSLIVCKNSSRSFTTSGRSCPATKTSFFTSLYSNPSLCNHSRAVRDWTIIGVGLPLGSMYFLRYWATFYELNPRPNREIVALYKRISWERMKGIITITSFSCKFSDSHL